MNAQQDKRHQEILAYLRRWESVSAFWLIVKTLLAWERRLFERHAVSKPRWVPETFKAHLDQLKLDSLAKVEDEGAILDDDQIDAKAREWSAELSLLPFEETIRSFAMAVNEWLSTNDLIGFKTHNESEIDTILKCYRFLVQSLGVD